MGAARRVRWRLAAPLLLLLCPGLALPVAAKPGPGPAAPVPTDTMEATTTTGMGAMGGAGMLQMMLGGRPCR
ncbi:hypothetical protein H6G65_04970 [Microcystis elabens FACHB-917]|nr:hypothetical protein [Microcystis elabens FACHB-917]